MLPTLGLKSESANKGSSWRSTNKGTQQQRPELPSVTLTRHTSKLRVHTHCLLFYLVAVGHSLFQTAGLEVRTFDNSGFPADETSISASAVPDREGRRG